MNKNDHKVIPKSILKRFVDKNNKVTCLNLKDYKVSKKTLNSIFTEDNYYIDEIDKYIRDKDESIIGNLYKSISENEDKTFSLKVSDIEYMRHIFFLQNFRNNSVSAILHSKVKNVDKKTIHNMILALLIIYLENGNLEDLFGKDTFEKIDKEYKMYTPGVIKLNNIERSFILPASQFTHCSIVKSDAYIYPIAPDIALIWKRDSEGLFEYGSTSYNRAVEKINQLIIEAEINIQADYVVFGKEDEIYRIIRNNKFKEEEKNGSQ